MIHKYSGCSSKFLFQEMGKKSTCKVDFYLHLLHLCHCAGVLLESLSTCFSLVSVSLHLFNIQKSFYILHLGELSGTAMIF